MSNTKRSTTENGEAIHTESSRKLYGDECIAIIQMFNHNPLAPLEVSDFKAMLFACLVDAYTNKRNSIFQDYHLNTMYHLWEILCKIEGLETIS